MAITFQHKRSSVGGNTPSAASISVGEIAINLADKILYSKDGAGNIIKVGTGRFDKLDGILFTNLTDGQVLTWDAANSVWKNGAAGGLPSQTGNSGKYLTTNGTNASWATLDLSAYLPLTGGTVTGTVTSTKAGGTSWGGAQLLLNGATLNRIDWNQNGSAAPSFTTRSAGVKLLLYPALDGSNTDHAIGIENSFSWFGVPNSANGWKWYAGTTVVATMSGAGALSVADASTTRTNLGLAIGTNVQAYSANLATIAGLTPTLDNFIVGNGTSWILETPAQARTSLGLVIGTNVQAWNADLDAIASLAGTSGLLRKTAANTWSLDTNTYLTSSSSLNASNLTSGTVATARLGTGTADSTTYLRGDGTWATVSGGSGTVTSVSGTGSVSGLTLSGTVTSSGSLTLSGAVNAVGGFSVNAFNDRNIRFYSNNAAVEHGLLAVNNAGTFAYQIYGTGTNYGFLNGAWAGWDLRKSNNGDLFVTVSGTERTVVHSATATWQNIQGNGINYGSYGSIGVAGLTNTYAGISFSAVSGTLMMNANATGFYYANSTWRVYWDGSGNQINTGNVTAYSSDERLKYNVVPIPNARKKLRQIDGVYFDWDLEECNKWNFYPPAHDIGLLAQRVQRIVPEAVHPAPFDKDPLVDSGSKSGKNYLTVQYEKLVPLLVQTGNEHDALIDELIVENERLNTIVSSLEERLLALEERL